MPFNNVCCVFLTRYKLFVQCGAFWMVDAMEMMLLSFIIQELDTEWNLSSSAEGLIAAVVFIGTHSRTDMPCRA